MKIKITEEIRAACKAFTEAVKEKEQAGKDLSEKGARHINATRQLNSAQQEAKEAKATAMRKIETGEFTVEAGQEYMEAFQKKLSGAELSMESATKFFENANAGFAGYSQAVHSAREKVWEAVYASIHAECHAFMAERMPIAFSARTRFGKGGNFAPIVLDLTGFNAAPNLEMQNNAAAGVVAELATLGFTVD